jgi:hypothetical protein
MMLALIFIIAVFYLAIGRIIAEKKWEWDGRITPRKATGMFITTIFWPIYLFWLLIKLLTSIFVDVDW